MPYIPQEDRDAIDACLRKVGVHWEPQNSGEINYTMTVLMDNYIKGKGGVRYTHLNDLIGTIELAKTYVRADSVKEAYEISDDDVNELLHGLKDEGLSWTPKTVEMFSEFLLATVVECKLSTIQKLGVLECCKLELYRLIAIPYEDKKLDENGPAYTINPLGGIAY